MSELLELMSAEPLIVSTSRRPIFFPVYFSLPPELQDLTPLKDRKQIEGSKVIRFYCPPESGDILEWSGHLWQVLGKVHCCQAKNSKTKGRAPTVRVQWLNRIG